MVRISSARIVPQPGAIDIKARRASHEGGADRPLIAGVAFLTPFAASMPKNFPRRQPPLGVPERAQGIPEQSAALESLFRTALVICRGGHGTLAERFPKEKGGASF
jgi:hypothetical protein